MKPCGARYGLTRRLQPFRLSVPLPRCHDTVMIDYGEISSVRLAHTPKANRRMVSKGGVPVFVPTCVERELIRLSGARPFLSCTRPPMRQANIAADPLVTLKPGSPGSSIKPDEPGYETCAMWQLDRGAADGPSRPSPSRYHFVDGLPDLPIDASYSTSGMRSPNSAEPRAAS